MPRDDDDFGAIRGVLNALLIEAAIVVLLFIGCST